MKWLKCSAILGAAIMSGVYLYKNKNTEELTPQQALQAVKHAVKDRYPIDGSWIHMTSEQMTRFDIPYTVYRGGLTTMKESHISHYDFTVDATTGTLLELIPN